LFASDESNNIMNKIARSLVLLVLCAFALSACGYGFGSQFVINYRLTVTVDDNGAVHTGTGVWRYRLIRGWSETFIAQAIPVDMGAKGTLFVLITDKKGQQLKDYDRFRFRKDSTQFEEGMERRYGQYIFVDCGDTQAYGNKSYGCPRMVRFTNERDPATVQAVDPTNLSASFGPGVSLRPITVTIVRNGPTKGLIKRLPWLKGPHNNDYLVEPPFSKVAVKLPLASALGYSDFYEGMNP
jgi:hypothetical protein